MRPRPLRLAPAVLGPVLVAAMLVGCGGSSSSGNKVASKSPEEIVAAAKAAADSAASVHLAGTIVSQGSPLSLDMQLLQGRGGRGRIAQNGTSFDLIALGGTVYINGSPAFYRRIGGAAAAQLFRGKWLKAAATSGNFSSIASLTDLRRLIDTTLSSHGTLSKGAETTVNGQKVVGLTDTSQGGALYIATTGRPFPIELAKSGSGGGHIVFDHWNQAVTIAPPPNAINLTQLQSGH